MKDKRKGDRHKCDGTGKRIRAKDLRKGDRHLDKNRDAGRPRSGKHTIIGFPPKFIGIDGEGQDFRGRHIYTLLQASNGYNLKGTPDLRTHEIFEGLLALKRAHKHHVMVGFALNYDVNMWLRDLPATCIEQMAETGISYWVIELFKRRYRIEWIPSKWFTLSLQAYDPEKRGWQTTQTVRVYDVFGFFQKSFVAALTEWDIGTPAERERIRLMKFKRGALERERDVDIKAYCNDECRLLVGLMNQLATALDTAGIHIKSWHGAGAIGGELLRMHAVKEHLEHDLPHEVRQAVECAFYGGRIQLLKVGAFENVWQHDINSAYPSIHRDLPSWQNLRILKTTRYVETPWAVYHVKWQVADDYDAAANRILTPFPFRNLDGSIDFPLNGEGWYWQPEVKAALAIWPGQIEVIEGFVFEPLNDTKPFAWIGVWYQKRLDFKNLKNPAQLPIKLGLNSLYGKMAQHSTREGREAPYRSMMNAGYITSAIRACLLELASHDPDSVIWFATDGIFASRKLTENEAGKPLGGWEVEPVEHLFVIQSGVYSFDGHTKTRGFNRDSLSFEVLQEVWARHGIRWHYHDDLAAGRRRTFIGLRYAHRTGQMDRWCSWPEVDKTIQPQFKGLTVEEDGIVDTGLDKRLWLDRCSKLPLKENYQIIQLESSGGISAPPSYLHSALSPERERVQLETLVGEDNIDTPGEWG